MAVSHGGQSAAMLGTRPHLPLESNMDWSANGEPVVSQDDPQVHVGLDLQQGTLILTQDGTDFVAYHALVEFASPGRAPGWRRRSASRPRGQTAYLWDCQ